MTGKILLTGHLGYIGAVLAEELVKTGYEVHGLDSGYYRDFAMSPYKADIPETIKDIRDVTAADVEGMEAVIHLAALSNDPIGNLNAAWTRQINEEASVRLATLAKEAGVERFLFSSSCIMYGLSDLAEVDETAPLAPQTEYARSKVRAEEAIRALAGDGFSPVFLRNGTIYGPSPSMRLDTVLNNLTAYAVATGKVTVKGDGAPWRPVAHVHDVARYFLAVLEAPQERIHNEALNMGHSRLNHQVRELAEKVAELIPGAELNILNEGDADQRTYQANFDKMARILPDFRFEWDIARGIPDLVDYYRKTGLAAEDLTGTRYVRLNSLRRLQEEGKIDGMLYPAATQPVRGAA